jgi:hypothetical protein
MINNKNICIVNLASGRFGWGQDRMIAALKKTGYKGGSIFHKSEADIPFKSHSQSMYGFKAGMIDKARKAGYRYILWADTSILPRLSILPIFEYIAKNGYWILQYGDFSNGEWCCDNVLPELGITRSESFKQPHAYATVYGLDIEKYSEYFNEFHEMALGTSFNGPWKNEDCKCSEDKRVLGHRHDQTIMSFLLWKHGMKNWIQDEERKKFWMNDGLEGSHILTFSHI